MPWTVGEGVFYSAVIRSRPFCFGIWKNIIIICQHGKYGVVSGTGIEKKKTNLWRSGDQVVFLKEMRKGRGDKFIYKKRNICFIVILKLFISLCIERPNFKFYWTGIFLKPTKREGDR